MFKYIPLLIFVGCDSLINGCSYCRWSEVEQLATCLECYPGLRLYSNTTFVNSRSIPFTSCVADCESASSAYVNNPFYQICESCGKDCKICDKLLGCLQCHSETSGYYLTNSNSSTKPTQTF